MLSSISHVQNVLYTDSTLFLCWILFCRTVLVGSGWALTCHWLLGAPPRGTCLSHWVCASLVCKLSPQTMWSFRWVNMDLCNKSIRLFQILTCLQVVITVRKESSTWTQLATFAVLPCSPASPSQRKPKATSLVTSEPSCVPAHNESVNSLTADLVHFIILAWSRIVQYKNAQRFETILKQSKQAFCIERINAAPCVDCRDSSCGQRKDFPEGYSLTNER